MASTTYVSMFLCLSLLLVATSSDPVKAASDLDASWNPKILEVLNYGAVGDGVTDNTIAFTNAWNDACNNTEFSTMYIYVPSGTYYLREITFSGPCNTPINFVIEGTLLAPKDPNEIKQAEWIMFYSLQNLTISGQGTLDGQGSYSWSLNDCNKNPKCLPQAVNIGFNHVNSSSIEGIRSINSKMGHFKLFAVNNFNISQVAIIAPDDSPNTDGIKIGRSNNVRISNVTIGTGDDCIAILSGSTNFEISNVKCGPGHGISIGSLGKYKEEIDVSGLKITNSVFNGTSNGVRIKTFAKSVSEISVSNVTYENIEMINVTYPIIIDQKYCPHNLCDKSETSSHVKIKGVKFNKIWGTSTKKEALRLQCSEDFHCQDIELSEINLAYNGTDGPAVALCENVDGWVNGTMVPGECLIN